MAINIKLPRDKEPLSYFLSFKRSFTKNQISLGVLESVADNLRQAELVIGEPIGQFACYTAEEEASGFVYLSLKEKGYELPDFKKLWSHQDKIKIFLLASCIHRYFFDTQLMEGAFLQLETVPQERARDTHKIMAHVSLPEHIPEHLKIVIPDPITIISLEGEGEEGLKAAAQRAVKDGLQAAGLGEGAGIEELIKNLANRRNACLYGNPRNKERLKPGASLERYKTNCVSLVMLGYLFLQASGVSEPVQKIIDVFFEKIDQPK